MNPNEMLNLKQAHEYLGISQGNLLTMVEEGIIPVYWLGKRRRFFVEDLKNAYRLGSPRK